MEQETGHSCGNALFHFPKDRVKEVFMIHFIYKLI